MIITVFFTLITVVFLMLMERKVLSYIEVRKGPNKVGILGLLQAISDAFKLFFKEQNFPVMSNYIMYMITPMMWLINSWMNRSIFPFLINRVSFNFGLLFILCCTSTGVYSVILMGWSSNSNFAMLGCIRSIAQSICYEVSLILILLCPVLMISLIDFVFIQELIGLIMLMLLLSFCWISSSVAETIRWPFDFSEGESELVSSFNVDYSGMGPAIIFLAEYSSINFIMSLLFCMMILGGMIYSFQLLFGTLFATRVVMMTFLFNWVHGTLPRYRYDKLMYLGWKCYLPVTLNLFIFFMIKTIS